jgi:hypothetical protein
MKRPKKLRLSREAIRILSSATLRIVDGGGRDPLPSNIDTACCNGETEIDCPSEKQPD